MATGRPSDLAIRDLVAVSLATIATYRVTSAVTTEVGNLAEVLAEVGHGDLAAALLANMRALYSTLDRVGDLAISPGKRAELMTAAAMPEAPYPGPMATPSGLREVRD